MTSQRETFLGRAPDTPAFVEVPIPDFPDLCQAIADSIRARKLTTSETVDLLDAKLMGICPACRIATSGRGLTMFNAHSKARSVIVLNSRGDTERLLKGICRRDGCGNRTILVFWRPDEDDALADGLAKLDFPCKRISLVPFRDERNSLSILHPTGWLSEAVRGSIQFYPPDAAALSDPEPNVRVYGLACTLRAGNIPAPPEDERTFLQNYMTGLMNRLDDPILASQKDVALSTGQVGLQTCFDYKIPGGHAFRACACVAIRRPAFLFYMDYTGLRLEVEKISHTIHKALLQSRLNPLERANNTSELTS